jgi:ribosomal protein S18 acetylase RimI-like enzyme
MEFTITNKNNNNKYSCSVRLAKKEDLDDIINIESICFPAAEAAKKEDFIKRFETFPENFLVSEIKENNNNKKIIGFINGCTTDKPELPDELYHNEKLHKKDGDYQTVFGIDVLPEYRKNGVGGKMMESLIKLSKERGKKGIVLTCKEHLIHFYEKFGYKNMGKSKSVHGGAVWYDMLNKF